MATRKKPTLPAEGKPRTQGGSARPWRVRSYAPEDGGTKYQVIFRTPTGEGVPWNRELRRAAAEEEARRIFAQAEAALDTETATPVGANIRASRTIRKLGEEFLRDSVERGMQPRTMEGLDSRHNAHILPTIGDVPARAVSSGLSSRASRPRSTMGSSSCGSSTRRAVWSSAQGKRCSRGSHTTPARRRCPCYAMRQLCCHPVLSGFGGSRGNTSHLLLSR